MFLYFDWHQKKQTKLIPYEIPFFRYGAFRLIDLPGLKKIMPVTMENFLEHVEKSTSDGVNKLRYDWLPECCAIIDMRRDDVEKWMPQEDEVRLLVLQELTFRKRMTTIFILISSHAKHRVIYGLFSLDGFLISN